jgi:hypothetical protein
MAFGWLCRFATASDVLMSDWHLLKDNSDLISRLAALGRFLLLVRAPLHNSSKSWRRGGTMEVPSRRHGRPSDSAHQVQCHWRRDIDGLPEGMAALQLEDTGRRRP